MVSTVLILGVSVFAFVLAWSLLRSTRSDIRDASDWERKKHDISVQIFRALLDRGEDHYLRCALSPVQFRFYRRKRIYITLRMLRLVEENAAMLIRLAHLAKLKRDPKLTAKADEMIATAMLFRLNLLLVRPCLYFQWIFPSWGFPMAAGRLTYPRLLQSLSRVEQHGWQPLH